MTRKRITAVWLSFAAFTLSLSTQAIFPAKGLSQEDGTGLTGSNFGSILPSSGLGGTGVFHSRSPFTEKLNQGNSPESNFDAPEPSASSSPFPKSQARPAVDATVNIERAWYKFLEPSLNLSRALEESERKRLLSIVPMPINIRGGHRTTDIRTALLRADSQPEYACFKTIYGSLFGRSNVLVLSVSGRVVRVLNLNGREKDVLFKLPNGQIITIGPGTEMIISKSLDPQELNMCDGIARRGFSRVMKCSELQMAFNQFSHTSVLELPELKFFVRNQTPKTLEPLMATVNKLDEVRGKTGFKMALRPGEKQEPSIAKAEKSAPKISLLLEKTKSEPAEKAAAPKATITAKTAELAKQKEVAAKAQEIAKAKEAAVKAEIAKAKESAARAMGIAKAKDVAAKAQEIARAKEQALKSKEIARAKEIAKAKEEAKAKESAEAKTKEIARANSEAQRAKELAKAKEEAQKAKEIAKAKEEALKAELKKAKAAEEKALALAEAKSAAEKAAEIARAKEEARKAKELAKKEKEEALKQREIAKQKEDAAKAEQIAKAKEEALKAKQIAEAAKQQARTQKLAEANAAAAKAKEAAAQEQERAIAKAKEAAEKIKVAARKKQAIEEARRIEIAKNEAIAEAKASGKTKTIAESLKQSEGAEPGHTVAAAPAKAATAKAATARARVALPLPPLSSVKASEVAKALAEKMKEKQKRIVSLGGKLKDGISATVAEATKPSPKPAEPPIVYDTPARKLLPRVMPGPDTPPHIARLLLYADREEKLASSLRKKADKCIEYAEGGMMNYDQQKKIMAQAKEALQKAQGAEDLAQSFRRQAEIARTGQGPM